VLPVLLHRLRTEAVHRACRAGNGSGGSPTRRSASTVDDRVGITNYFIRVIGNVIRVIAFIDVIA